MHPRTVRAIQDLEKAAWFSRVGVKDTTAAIVLSSWQEAIKHCSSLEWENLCLEAVNQYCERLVERSKERWQRWNDIAIEIRPVAQALVQKKTKQVIEENNLPKVFQDTVDWDIAHLLMEAEYADVYPPGYYASQAYWYTKGHFPCGWEGKFPEGKLIIY